MKNWITNCKKLYRGFLQAGEAFAKMILVFLVGLYRTIGSQFLGGQCRFQPSCSHYALEAIQTHQVPHAIELIIKRILRCQPFGSSGWDPVPLRKENLNAREQSAAKTF